MHKLNPTVLHIAEMEPNPLVVEVVARVNGYPIHTDNLMEALAAYTFYVPDVVVVEAPMGSWLGQEALVHLDSVDARPLVILTDRRDLWSTPAVHRVYVRPLDVGGNALLGTLARALEFHTVGA